MSQPGDSLELEADLAAAAMVAAGTARVATGTAARVARTPDTRAGAAQLRTIIAGERDVDALEQIVAAVRVARREVEAAPTCQVARVRVGSESIPVAPGDLGGLIDLACQQQRRLSAQASADRPGIPSVPIGGQSPPDAVDPHTIASMQQARQQAIQDLGTQPSEEFSPPGAEQALRRAGRADPRRVVCSSPDDPTISVRDLEPANPARAPAVRAGGSVGVAQGQSVQVDSLGAPRAPQVLATQGASECSSVRIDGVRANGTPVTRLAHVSWDSSSGQMAIVNQEALAMAREGITDLSIDAVVRGQQPTPNPEAPGAMDIPRDPAALERAVASHLREAGYPRLRVQAQVRIATADNATYATAHHTMNQPAQGPATVTPVPQVPNLRFVDGVIRASSVGLGIVSLIAAYGMAERLRHAQSEPCLYDLPAGTEVESELITDRISFIPTYLRGRVIIEGDRHYILWSNGRQTTITPDCPPGSVRHA
jgi:hypothetical protein